MACANSFTNGSNLINGTWEGHIGSSCVFEKTYPADTRKVLAIFPNSRFGEIDRAVEAARNIFPSWKKLGMVKRAEILWNAARLLEDDLEGQSRIVTTDSGKQINEAMADVLEALHMIQYAFSYGHIGKHTQGGVFADEVSSKFCFVLEEPRGVVAAITPWNFPWAIPMWLTALSLVTGNVVILKPSEETPLCGHEIAKIFHRAGVPKGVFQVIHGDGRTGELLVAHPEINTVLFTGSYGVGSNIKEIVAKFPNKNCTIETGSKSAVIVLKDANMDMAVKAAVASAFKTAGQRCVSGGRIIIEKVIFDEFCEKFINIAKMIKTGDPFNQDTFYGPMINKVAVEKGRSFNLLAIEEGFEILLDRQDDIPNTHGHWLGPFVYTGKWNKNSRCLTEEAFAPHTALIPANDTEDALRIYNDTDYGLSGAVFTDNIHKALKTILEMECGITYQNLPCIGAGVRMPFGGVKKSGGLIPSAAGILPAITHTKSVTLNLDEEIVMAQGLKI